nr:hypothetical protein [uncultured Glaciecola sp.]
MENAFLKGLVVSLALATSCFANAARSNPMQIDQVWLRSSSAVSAIVKVNPESAPSVFALLALLALVVTGLLVVRRK